jgi:hypothetical protein
MPGGNGSSMSSTSCPREASKAETSSQAATQAGSGMVPLAVVAQERSNHECHLYLPPSYHSQTD